MKRVLRNIQTLFPFLQDARFALESRIRRSVGSVHDSDWMAFELLQLGDGPVVDVGANRGQSIDSFQIVMPERHVISFEPNSRLAESLKRQHSSNSRVSVHATALSNKSSRMKLYLPKYRDWVFDGLASLDVREALEWLNPDRMWNFDPRKLSTLEMDVEVRTLDQFGFSPAVIKLDTQGTEEDVLRGSRETLHKCRPIILLESATDGISSFLSEFGYKPYTFRSGTFSPNDISGKNVFFLTDSHLLGPKG